MKSNTSTPLVCASILAIGVAVGFQKPASIADPIAGYRTWTKVNATPIYMEPAVAGSCVGPSWWDSQDNPHVPKYFTVYVNSIGKVAMESPHPSKFSVGSVIVKEKFASSNPSAKPELLTVMIKHSPGYDKHGGDWEYMVVNGNLTKRSGANTKSCQSCHSGYSGDDFTFRNYVKGHDLEYSRFRNGDPGIGATTARR